MTGRAQIAALLRAAQPTWTVVEQARTPDNVTRPTAVLWASQVTRQELAQSSLIRATVDLWILPPADTTATVLEDLLDELMLDVINALEPAPFVAWDTASRGTLDGVWHGWHFPLTVVLNLEQE